MIKKISNWICAYKGNQVIIAVSLINVANVVFNAFFVFGVFMYSWNVGQNSTDIRDTRMILLALLIFHLGLYSFCRR